MTQITVRGFDKATERRIREEAKARGVSINQAAVLLLSRGAGTAAAPASSGRIGTGLDRFFGGWSAREAAEFEASIRPFEKVDAAFWK